MYLNYLNALEAELVQLEKQSTAINADIKAASDTLDNAKKVTWIRSKLEIIEQRLCSLKIYDESIARIEWKLNYILNASNIMTKACPFFSTNEAGFDHFDYVLKKYNYIVNTLLMPLQDKLMKMRSYISLVQNRLDHFTDDMRLCSVPSPNCMIEESEQDNNAQEYLSSPATTEETTSGKLSSLAPSSVMFEENKKAEERQKPTVQHI